MTHLAALWLLRSCAAHLTATGFRSHRRSPSPTGLAQAGLYAFLIGSQLAFHTGCGQSLGDACKSPSGETLEELRGQASAVFDAIEQYRKVHEAYPASLADLVPDYISDIPTPSWGQGRWDYLPPNPEVQRFGLLIDVKCKPARHSIYFFTARMYEDGNRSFDHWGT